jgi:hypothetical protein
MFWRELLACVDNYGAQAFQHARDDGVRPDQDTAFLYLRFQMPIANMPCKLGKMNGTVPPHLQQIFGLCRYLNEAAILQHKAIAILQLHRLGEIDQHFTAVFKYQQFAPQVARLGLKFNLGPRPFSDEACANK